MTARFSGFVEKLFVSQTGDVVRAGQPLMRVWIQSSDVLVHEADYIGSLASNSQSQAASAASLLRQYGVPQSELDAMAKTGAPTRTIAITAPMNGTVMNKPIMEGMHFNAGDPLFQTTDVSRLWVLADVSQPGGADQRVADRVQQHVAVRVPQQALGMRDFHPADDQLAPRRQRVDVEALAYLKRHNVSTA